MKTHALALALCATAAFTTAAHADPLIIDFETDALGATIQPGQLIDSEYAPIGLHISAQNRRSSHPDAAITFNSSSPTGGDWDLRTPVLGNVGPNTTNADLHNILIIAEDIVDNNNDGLVDDPDDEARGGTLFFNFDLTQNTAGTFTLVDIEEYNGCIAFYHEDAFVSFIHIPPLGNNSLQTLAFPETTFDEIRVQLTGSGAVGSFALDDGNIVPEPASLALLSLSALALARRRPQGRN